jgi:hypothetical protein
MRFHRADVIQMMLTEHLEGQRKTVLIVIGLLILALVVAIDYMTRTRYVLEFSPFYVLPVAFFTWFVNCGQVHGIGSPSRPSEMESQKPATSLSAGAPIPSGISQKRPFAMCDAWVYAW